ncbi:hypothetical protein [Luteolibacter sp. LG18]|uniref:hypothetical protein n=1 Tax=Luteolibacter sp. LG18 TaxID=2819286 RepID=UPI002B3161D4|nr:hypothetical protein llg_04430 [Luteolibacter sp. LG18]
MNRRRTDIPRSHFTTYLSVIAGAVVAAFGGVTHAYYMNRQVEARREVHRIEVETKEHELEILTTQMRVGELLNRYTVREELAHQHSSLKPIGRGVVEDVRPAQPRAVVSAVP